MPIRINIIFSKFNNYVILYFLICILCFISDDINSINVFEFCNEDINQKESKGIKYYIIK